MFSSLNIDRQTLKFSLNMLRKASETKAMFFRRTHAQNEHGFTFLEAMKVPMTRIQFFGKLKMLRHAQIQIVVKPNVSKKGSPIFHKRKRYTRQIHFFLNSNFQLELL